MRYHEVIQSTDTTATIIWTAVATLLAGLTLFIISEVLKTLVLRPLQYYKESARKAISSVDFNSKYLTNHFPRTLSADQKALVRKIEDDLRIAGTELTSSYNSISGVKILGYVGIVPKQGDIDRAYGSLIYLHNSILYTGEIDDHNNTSVNREKIQEVKDVLS